MARSVNNIFTQGIRGMIAGQMVFKTWNGKTFVCKSPRKPSIQSPQQRENRTRFRRATAFAKKMMADPIRKAEYKAIAENMSLPNAYTAAVTEYMRKPEILDIEIDESAESPVLKVITTKKGFEIERVDVILQDLRGNVLEEGSALKKPGNEWWYWIKIDVDCQAFVRVRDKAGNEAEEMIGSGKWELTNN